MTTEGFVSVPVAVTPQAFGAVADGIADDAAAIAAAIAHIDSLGGGSLYLPRGTYAIGSAIALCRNLTVRGDGYRATIIKSSVQGANAQSGSAFFSSAAVNASSAANITIRDLGVVNTNPANIGAGYYDQGGSFVRLDGVRVERFKYGVIFDQTELADIDGCDFEAQGTAGLWLVNGLDLNAAASPGYTNRIGVRRSQFNEGATAYGIVDDGGTAHAFSDNNYNGCLNHIRAAGVTGLSIDGGEFESAAGHNISLVYTRLSGGSVGSCPVVRIVGTTQAATGANSCIQIGSAAKLTIEGNLFSTPGANSIIGTGNVFQLELGNNSFAYPADQGVDGYGSLTMKPTLYAQAQPTSGFWRRGQLVMNGNPVAGAVAGWRCLTSGSPGTWETVRWS